MQLMCPFSDSLCDDTLGVVAADDPLLAIHIHYHFTVVARVVDTRGFWVQMEGGQAPLDVAEVRCFSPVHGTATDLSVASEVSESHSTDEAGGTQVALSAWEGPVGHQDVVGSNSCIASDAWTHGGKGTHSQLDIAISIGEGGSCYLREEPAAIIC